MALKQERFSFPSSAFITAFLDMHKVEWACYLDEEQGEYYLRAEHAHWTVQTPPAPTVTHDMGMQFLELVRNRLGTRP
ncbi:hypothetical protein HNQ07_001927 [Deinococcus metalli]|jgi:hypothetical protein|uniref:Uncharacterized protein n=1 Tax=Deinococcus metalli TaxID=1141878 RepID=A0A7W8KG30_9DEIO|nr:hypothetical protein [Deinococcus metalli]MBB5376463.1 hypothetical protein [Deinococcus metalli]GHF43847.1 hypothetical protein GCM10017781_20380 [Deinococcus metalli]